MAIPAQTGLVLSGGGARGVGHLGLIKALEQYNIDICEISGTSAGALIGAMYANGMTVEDIKRFFKEVPLFKITFFALRRPGILNSYRYMESLEEFLPPTFDKLKIPLTVNAVNLDKAINVYFDVGELLKPIAASCSVPMVFTPVRIDKEFYGDGGIMNNFPIEPLKCKNLYTMGGYVNNPGTHQERGLRSSFRVLNRSYLLLQHANNIERLGSADLLFDFPVREYGVFETSKIDEIYTKCYDLSMRILERKFGKREG